MRQETPKIMKEPVRIHGGPVNSWNTQFSTSFIVMGVAEMATKMVKYCWKPRSNVVRKSDQN